MTLMSSQTVIFLLFSEFFTGYQRDSAASLGAIYECSFTRKNISGKYGTDDEKFPEK